MHTQGNTKTTSIEPAAHQALTRGRWSYEIEDRENFLPYEGEIDAIDVRDAVSRALTSEVEGGAMLLGRALNLSPRILHDLPCNDQASYSVDIGSVSITVKRL